MALEDVCVFCRILRGEIPCSKVYEDDKVLAFLDIAPFNPGHTVIIPKKHEVSATVLEDEYLSAMMCAAPKIGAALMRATGAEGFNLVLNNGRVAGQMVPHVHLHVIPRFADDDIVIHGKEKGYSGQEEMNELLAKIQKALNK